ncbi:hypothetical protein TCON_0074 [Astathelohania contejeani]|uniref:Uncharacterized protein n=1 Tax=Astathelohania contejeani TaxID=164912 RepID=A0ABQ7I2S9_9MICR|nr:hypothetical protein TCON_0074 [Thelohania contejeani]
MFILISFSLILIKATFSYDDTQKVIGNINAELVPQFIQYPSINSNDCDSAISNYDQIQEKLPESVVMMSESIRHNTTNSKLSISAKSHQGQVQEEIFKNNSLIAQSIEFSRSSAEEIISETLNYDKTGENLLKTNSNFNNNSDVQIHFDNKSKNNFKNVKRLNKNNYVKGKSQKNNLQKIGKKTQNLDEGSYDINAQPSCSFQNIDSESDRFQLTEENIQEPQVYDCGNECEILISEEYMWEIYYKCYNLYSQISTKYNENKDWFDSEIINTENSLIKEIFNIQNSLFLFSKKIIIEIIFTEMPTYQYVIYPRLIGLQYFITKVYKIEDIKECRILMNLFNLLHLQKYLKTNELLIRSFITSRNINSLMKARKEINLILYSFFSGLLCGNHYEKIWKCLEIYIDTSNSNEFVEIDYFIRSSYAINILYFFFPIHMISHLSRISDFVLNDKEILTSKTHLYNICSWLIYFFRSDNNYKSPEFDLYAKIICEAYLSMFSLLKNEYFKNFYDEISNRYIISLTESSWKDIILHTEDAWYQFIGMNQNITWKIILNIYNSDGL